MANTLHRNERHFVQKLANVFLRTRKVRVHSIDTQDAVAFCNVVTKEMWFNFDDIFYRTIIDNDKFRQMMVFKGLGFHEIMHLKFTPIERNVSISQIATKIMGYLEDGRIETLGVMLHEKLADYFICAVDDILLKDKNAIIQNKDNWLIYAYILCYGRSIYFQDKDLLATMRSMIISIYGKEVADMIENSVNDYLPEKDVRVRIRIAESLAQFLVDKNIYPKLGKGCPATTTFIDTTNLQKDANDDKDLKELEKDFPRLKDALGKIQKELQEKTKNVKDDKEKREASKEEQKKKIADLRQEIRDIDAKIYNEKEPLERGKLRSKSLDVQKHVLEEQKNSSYTPDNQKELQDKLDEQIAEKSKEQEKLTDTHKDDLTKDLMDIGQLSNAHSDNSFVVTDTMQMLAKRLENGLVKLNNELAKGYQDKNKSGRLNVRSLLNRKSIADARIFNRYQPDKLRLTKALVNIYLDGSGSMRGDWQRVIGTCWIINEALNRDSNKVMIYQFSNNFELVKEYDMPLSVPKITGGNTHPELAIEHSIPIIEAYRRSKNFSFVVDIIITDGRFDDYTLGDCAIEKLNRLGHETIIIKVNDDPATHNAKHSMNLLNFDELVGSLTKIFIEIKKGLIAHAKVM